MENLTGSLWESTHSSPSVSFLSGCGFRRSGLDIKHIHVCEEHWGFLEPFMGGRGEQ